MKKVALSLLALALFGAGAFAQTAASGLTIGGYLDVGTQTQMYKDSGTQTIVKGDDSGIVGGSYEFKGAYALSDKAGMKFNVRLETLLGLATKYNTQNIYGWFIFPGVDALKILVGNIDGSGWGGNDDVGGNVSGGAGIQAQFVADALTIGGQYHAPTPLAAGFPTLSFGAKYAIADVATIVVGAKTGLTDKNAATLDSAYVTASIAALAPISLSVGYNLNAMSGVSDSGNNVLDVKAGMSLTDALSATLIAYVTTYGSKVLATDTGKAASLAFKVNPSVTYKVSDVYSAGVGVTYASGYNVSSLKADKVSMIEVAPTATAQIDANSKLIGTFVYDMFSGDATKNVLDLTQMTFKLDYRYSF